tara:strand:- start:862 stop:1080 length:219 start_codon:yes stop_codon:yes gene_type:complete
MRVKSVKIWTREAELTDEMLEVGNLAAKDFKSGIESGDYTDTQCLVFGSNRNLSVFGKLGKSGQLSLMVYGD